MDAATLATAMGNVPGVDYVRFAPGFSQAMRAANINSQRRAAMWCAQIGHESAGLRWMEEIADGSAYNGRADLGNTQPGDGPRFKGRGPIQLTGRFNYRAFTRWANGAGHTSINFEAEPYKVSEPQWGFLAAAWYWTVARPQLNSLSDAGDLDGATRAINGGLNGLADRRQRYQRCISMKLLGGASVKNWENVEPDKYTLVGSHRFTKGRSRPIDRIVIHHNAGVKLTSEQVRDLWNNSREASAHYQVEANGVIGQLVNDWDTAWHAANADINARSIGIEHANISGPDRWQISDATIENGAHLTAALCKAYKLGRPTWGKNVFPHSQYTSTGCPWQLDVGGEDHKTYMRRAGYWYDKMTKPGAKPASKPVSKAALAPQKTTGGTVDKAQADRIEKKLNLVLDQLVGPGKDAKGPLFTGWKQLDGKTLVDAVAEIRNAFKGGK